MASRKFTRRRFLKSTAAASATAAFAPYIRTSHAAGKLEVGGVELDLILETRGHDHIGQLLRVFHAEGITAQELS